jgi:flagellar secretion chaperone FliS
MSNPYQKYKATAVTSASREKLLLMLYEAAMKFCKLAIIACEKKNISDRGLNIGKTYDIVMELANTLDHNVGGEISKNLEQLYIFMMDQLTKANISGNAEHLKNVLKLLDTLYTAWVGAIEKLKKDTESREG